MTPEEVKKEQEASNIKPIQPIQQVNTEPAQLGKSQPMINTPPAESDKEYAGKVKDYKTIVSEAKSKGIDLNDQEGVPLLDSDKERIIQNVSKLAPKELITNAVNRINTYAQPELKKVPELDQKRLMDQERKIRRARWADALYAFGEGLQGRTANPETFATTRLQRQKDQEFKNYLDVTEKNRIAKNAWNKETTNETIKWLDEQANNERQDRLTREKYAQAAEELKQNLLRKDREFAERQRHNKAMENKPSGKLDKELRPVIVQTAKNTYELKPEEAARYKGEVLQNSEKYRAKYPGLFEKVQETDKWTGKPIEGKFSYKLNPRIKDIDLIRAYLEDKEPGKLNEDAYEQNKTSYFDKYRKERGLPTSDQPALKPQTKQPQTPKSDPLNF